MSTASTAAVCDISLLMREIDGIEGEDNPPRVKGTGRVFPPPTYNASTSSALGIFGTVNSCECVVDRPPVLIILPNTTKQHYYLKIRVSLYRLSIITPILFCEPKIYLIF